MNVFSMICNPWRSHSALFSLPAVRRQAVLKSLSPILITTLLLVTSGTAHALGFGALALSSHLDEPLTATIPLILTQSDDLDTVRIELASPADYRQFGVPWQADLSRIHVFVKGKHSALPNIVLHSAEPIHASMLSLLLKAQKNGRGTYYKQFKLLFDPAGNDDLQPQLAIISASDTPVDKPSVHAPIMASTEHGSASRSDSDSASDQGWARVWQYGPVRAGDSLSEIAYRLRRDKRFSNYQVMLSLYKQNPQDFVEGDINQLKRGAWLNVPHADVVKRYAGKAAMQQLSMLLNSHPASSKAEPATRRDTPAPMHETSDQHLRYSGNVTINRATAEQTPTALTTLQTKLNARFDSMHTDMMAGTLKMVKQMTGLSQSVNQLHQSMHTVQQDIRAIQRDLAKLKQRNASKSSGLFSNEAIALLVLLAGLCGMLIAIILRKKNAAHSRTPQANPAIAADATVPATETSPHQSSTPVTQADKTVQLLNQAEESLRKCDYETAEKLLTQIDSNQPGSLRASALKAQLYHETERHSARNDLINSISEDSDKQRWERFCNLLPSHVWNACFGADTPPEHHAH